MEDTLIGMLLLPTILLADAGHRFFNRYQNPQGLANGHPMHASIVEVKNLRHAPRRASCAWCCATITTSASSPPSSPRNALVISPATSSGSSFLQPRRAGRFWPSCMNKLWKQLAIATNWPVLVAVAVLSALGLVSIWAHSLADPESARDAGCAKTNMFIAIGVTLMFAMQAVNYLQLGRWGWPFYILSLLLLIYTIIPGMPTHGSFRRGRRSRCKTLDQPRHAPHAAGGADESRLLRRPRPLPALPLQLPHDHGLLAPFALAIVPADCHPQATGPGHRPGFHPRSSPCSLSPAQKSATSPPSSPSRVSSRFFTWFAGPDGGDVPVLRRLPSLVKPYQRARVAAMFSTDPKVLQGAGFQQHRRKSLSAPANSPAAAH
jgi:hypothetical protein